MLSAPVHYIVGRVRMCQHARAVCALGTFVMPPPITTGHTRWALDRYSQTFPSSVV